MIPIARGNDLSANSRGDTIVEVLITTAIISTVLVGGFAAASQSSVAVRDSQEHAEALMLLQGQVESLRPLGSKTSPIYGTNIFCINGTGTVQTGFGYSTVPSLATDDFSQYPAACRNVNNLYNLATSYDGNTQVFTFLVRWDRLSGGRDQVSLYYKLPPVVASTPPSLALPNYTSCDDAGISAETYYFDFRKYPTPASRDWHVKYAPAPSHPIASIPYLVSPAISPGQYAYWAFSQDSSVNPTATNQALHYLLQNISGVLMARTADTPPITNTATASAVITGTIDIAAGQSVASVLVEHGPVVPASSDDSVDGACLALRLLP